MVPHDLEDMISRLFVRWTAAIVRWRRRLDRDRDPVGGVKNEEKQRWRDQEIGDLVCAVIFT